MPYAAAIGAKFIFYIFIQFEISRHLYILPVRRFEPKSSNVDTPPNAEPWKDVEITGYARVVDAIPIEGNPEAATDDFDLNWLARGGEHNTNNPCEGSAYTAILDINGTVGWKKEIWFPGGYTDDRGTEDKLKDSLLNRWVGFKAIMYNTNNNTAVKLESYIDNRNTNYWVKVTDLLDNGDWYEIIV